jgi:hypothetical protein
MRFFSCSVTSLWLWLWIASFRRLDGQKLEPVEADENGNHDDDDKWLIPFIVSSIRSSSSPHPSPDNGATADGFVWHNLSVHTRRRHGGADGRGMTILHPSSFVVRNGQVTGLLGPSGMYKLACMHTARTLSLTHFSNNRQWQIDALVRICWFVSFIRAWLCGRVFSIITVDAY